MARVNVEIQDSGDVPDYLIGRFVDRLDHIPFRLVRPSEDNLRDMHQRVSRMEARYAEHAEIIASHDRGLSSVATAQRKIQHLQRPPLQPSPSHRGEGTVPPVHRGGLDDLVPEVQRGGLDDLNPAAAAPEQLHLEQRDAQPT